VTLVIKPGIKLVLIPDVGPVAYWADMGVQMFDWESLAYIGWWGN
jgi:hypothetical protein